VLVVNALVFIFLAFYYRCRILNMSNSMSIFDAVVILILTLLFLNGGGLIFKFLFVSLIDSCVFFPDIVFISDDGESSSDSTSDSDSDSGSSNDGDPPGDPEETTNNVDPEHEGSSSDSGSDSHSDGSSHGSPSGDPGDPGESNDDLDEGDIPESDGPRTNCLHVNQHSYEGDMIPDLTCDLGGTPQPDGSIEPHSLYCDSGVPMVCFDCYLLGCHDCMNLEDGMHYLESDEEVEAGPSVQAQAGPSVPTESTDTSETTGESEETNVSEVSTSHLPEASDNYSGKGKGREE